MPQAFAATLQRPKDRKPAGTKRLGARYWRFLRRVGLLLVLPALVICVNIAFIYNASENASFASIVAEQLEKDAIYGTTLSQNPWAYKLELVKAVSPEVLALGSSRVMQLRREFFSTSFANAGGAVNYIAEAPIFLSEMQVKQNPKLVILGLDFWWFNPAHVQPKTFPYHDNDGQKLTFEKLTTPLEWLWRGDVSLSEYADILVKSRRDNPNTNHVSLGVRAITRGDGFRADGSYLFGRLISGNHPSFADERFVDTLNRVNAGTAQFAYGSGIDPGRVRQLYEVIDWCRERGVALILFLPPQSDTVYAAMMADPARYGHLTALRALLPTLPVEAYDFTEMSSLGSFDCECLDGFHGGDVTYQRLLLKILEINPGSALAAYVDKGKLEKSVAANAGRVLTKYDPGKYKYPEGDFLKMGCPK